MQVYGCEKPIDRFATTTDRQRLLQEPNMAAIVVIEASLLKAARNYFAAHNFVEVTVPHITRVTGACENIDTLFKLDYFGESAFLVQTGQLYLEALIPNLGNVFCIGPSFRAEPAVDNRHLTEFTLVEIEFPGDFEKLLVHIENIVYNMIQGVLKDCPKELAQLGVFVDKLKHISLPFRRITYTQAIEQLQREGVGVAWGDDLKSHHEAKMVSDGQPTFITHYPEAIKFFNMRRNPENPSIVNSSDLILPFGGEAVGSAEREWDYDLLREKLLKSPMYRQLVAQGKSIKDFDWYLELIRQRPIQHSGCGIGLNRVMQLILGSTDIRTSTAYPMNRESLM